ncbi:TolB family protein [Nonomuraea endophytica]|uniref:TolB family protein n=1 Tax=Nonomuraea endophytica TaxID=714136 RepID=UPI0037C57E10
MTRRLLAALTILGVLAATPAPVAAEGAWVRLPGTRAELNTAPAPVKVTGYVVLGYRHEAIYRRQGGTFVKVSGRPEDLSPDGRWRVDWEYPDHPYKYLGLGDVYTRVRKVTLVDRRSGRRVPVRLPAGTGAPSWSPDGKSLLFTAYGPEPEQDGGSVNPTQIGFVVLPLAGLKPRLVKAGTARPLAQVDLIGSFSWAPDSAGVLTHRTAGKDLLELYDLQGTRKRVYQDVGRLAEDHSLRAFSPSGELFVTVDDRPMGGPTYIRVVRAGTGAVVLRLTAELFTEFYGWYDENRLILSYRDKKMITRFKAVDLSGRPGVTLIKEQIVAGPASYEPHITSLLLARPGDRDQ